MHKNFTFIIFLEFQWREQSICSQYPTVCRKQSCRNVLPVNYCIRETGIMRIQNFTSATLKMKFSWTGALNPNTQRTLNNTYYFCPEWLCPEKENPDTDPTTGEGDPATGEAGSPSEPTLRVRGFAGSWCGFLSTRSCRISWMWRPFLYRSMPLTTFFSGWKCGMST